MSPFSDALRGSDLRALALHRLLSPRCPVLLWTQESPDPRFSDYPIRRIAPYRGQFPRGGTLVIVGVYFPLGHWLRHAAPRRTIVVYNTVNHEQFFATLQSLRKAGLAQPDLAFVSAALRDALGLPGEVLPPFFDFHLERFTPRTSARRPNDRFTVGRLSRDTPRKHHSQDPSLYRMLAEHGCQVRIMGGTCLGSGVSGRTGIELLPAGAEPAPEFLHSLDCFFYRTADDLEAAGTVVAETMACGLPAVCHRRGGYVEWIEHGRNGFLFNTQEQAYDQIMALARDPGLTQEVGRRARERIEALCSGAAQARLVDYFVGR